MPAADRSATCTDVAPDSQFTCEEQANEYDKCNASFIYLYSYCLKSCKRCGEARGMIERMGWLVGGIPICRDFELRCIIQFSWQLTPSLLVGDCADTPPPNGTCSEDACNSDAVTAGPYCLKTCHRCTTATA